ncbi:MAG: aldo/keto reductase [Candidatus Njordarchaeales archaeon]
MEIDYNDLKEIGKTGVKVPAIGFGTWKIGGGFSPDYSRDDYFVSIIKKAIEYGLWHIDTAEMYGDGHAEELVGRAIRDFDRDAVFITTKVSGDHLAFNDVIKAVKRSLERLGIKYIDLYLVHWPNPTIPLRETIKAMEELVNRGWIRFIGVSNFSKSLLEEARTYLSKEDIVNNQVQFSLTYRSPESELLPYCQREGITLTAHTPLDKGRLAKNKMFQEIGKKYNKTAAQVALNWLISKPRVITIPKASSEEHIRENAGAMGWRLKEEDLKLLNKIR